MIGPEDFGERHPVNHTPTIALGIAALLLLVVGAMSYSDYVRKRYDKEYAAKEEQLIQRMQQLGYAPPVNPGSGAALPPAQVLPGAVAPAPIAAPTAMSPAVAAPAGIPASPALAAVVQSTEGALTPPNDPEIEAARQSLAQARMQSQAAEERFHSLAATPAGVAPPPAVEPGPPATAAADVPFDEELPPFLRQAEAERIAAEAASRAEVDSDAVVTQDLAKVRQAVSRANSLGKVVSYDDEWGLVTFNAGSANGVVVDKRFAVRRGSDLLGWVKVDKVFENESIAILVTKNRSSDTAAKPAPGDDLIDFELF
jgi:hypothetical protein